MGKKLLLISIASDSHRNIGCLSLFATTMDAGIYTNLLFIPRRTEYSEKKFCTFLRTNDFDIIGISLTTMDFDFAKTLTADIRKYLPKGHVVWGGIHATSKPEECLNYADSICIGESELTLVQLVTALRNSTDISGIPGVGVKSGDEKKTLIMNPPQLVHDLNTLPFPYFDFKHYYVLDACGLHLFGPKDYKKYARHNGDGYVLLTSRSCPHKCSYCINSFLNRLYEDNSARIYRRRSVDNVMVEINHALNTIPGIGFINFMDDHFLVDSKWMKEFCEKYKKHINLPFIIRATPVSINDEKISLLKNAGLHTVQMGIQSGSERTHKTIFHRSFNPEVILRAAHILTRYNLVCLYDFIIENDFETDEDRDKTIELMLRIPKPYIANVFAMTVFPGTDLESMYKERKMTPRIDPYSSNYFDFKENDFYYKLACLIPLIDEQEARHIFKSRKDPEVLARLRELFLEKVPATS